MTQTPSFDRSPPPDVPALVRDGVSYEQDSSHGNGGWLIARDVKTGAKFWEVEVFHVEPPGPDAPTVDPTGYFESMIFSNPHEITVTREYSPDIRYTIDLTNRKVTRYVADHEKRSHLPSAANRAP